MKKLVIILLLFTVLLVSACHYTAERKYNKAKQEVDELNRKIEQVTPDYQRVASLKAEIQDIKEKYGTGIDSLNEILEGEKPLIELVDKLYSSDANIRRLAIMVAIAYAQKGKETQESFMSEVLPVLLERLKDDDTETRVKTAAILRELPLAAKEVIPELTEALDDESAKVRMDIILALTDIGPEAAQALPKLREISESDDSEDIRQAALEAIKQIEGIVEPKSVEDEDEEGK